MYGKFPMIHDPYLNRYAAMDSKMLKKLRLSGLYGKFPMDIVSAYPLTSRT